MTAAPAYQEGDPVSWVGTRGSFDWPLTVDHVHASHRPPARWLYDLRDGAGRIVIYSAEQAELMPSITDGAQ